MPIKLQVRRGTAASWVSSNPTLLQGEIGFETDTGNFKIGDGTNLWNDLAYQFPYLTGSRNHNPEDTTTLVVDQTNDRVGIGKSNPSTLLDVNGVATATSFVGYGISPIGSVIMYAGSSAPSGWLLCNGQTISRSTYASLFTAIGTTYGSGDGSTTFAVPNLTGRVAIGLNGSGAYAATLGTTGGSADAIVVSHTHTGTIDSSGDHTHTITLQRGGYGGTVAKEVSVGDTGTFTNLVKTSSSSGSHTHTFTIDSTGSSATNANLPPYLTLNYIIRAL